MPDDIDVKFLTGFKKVIVDFIKRGNRVILICGGGNICREYQSTAKKINPKISPIDLDWLGIAITKINALMVKNIFGQLAEKRLLLNPTKKIKTTKRVIIGCGWKPGSSSDKDAVLAAKTFGIKTVVNLSNIVYVYNKDPRQFKDAKPKENMSWKEFRKVIGNVWKPGAHVPFDPIAAKFAQKWGQRLVVMKGNDLKNLKSFLAKKKFKGTVIEN